MPSDDEKDDHSTHLTEREQFVGWKSSMRLHAMSKGDSYGIFDEDGTQGTYVALQAPQRRSWMETTRKLVGEIGKKIRNPTLQHLWSAEYERIAAQAEAAAATGARPEEDYRC